METTVKQRYEMPSAEVILVRTDNLMTASPQGTIHNYTYCSDEWEDEL